MKSQARLRLRRPRQPEATMLKVAGRWFRCPCGANVFTRKGGGVAVAGQEVYECNACGRWYQ